MPASYILRLAVLAATLFSLAANSFGGQSLGNSTALYGTVLDATGAVVVGATVKIHNPVSELDRSAQTNTTGGFVFQNVPFNPYHLTITAKGFVPFKQDVELRSIVPVTLTFTLTASVAATTV